MDTRILVGPSVKDFERLLHLLDQEGLPIVAAFLRENQAVGTWQLVIASPEVDRIGSLPVYEQLQRAFSKAGGGRLTLDDVRVMGLDNPVLVRLRRIIPDGGPIEHLNTRLTVPDYSTEEGTPVGIYMLRWQPESRNGGTT